MIDFNSDDIENEASFVPFMAFLGAKRTTFVGARSSGERTIRRGQRKNWVYGPRAEK